MGLELTQWLDWWKNKIEISGATYFKSKWVSADIIKQNEINIISSPLGTGKTTAVKDLIDNVKVIRKPLPAEVMVINKRDREEPSV
ncbi:hypothetical protein MEO41_28955, partial [Dolichospermum sp. ST_sed4]|nr:hypothetical protein [Dolichospermum sp. ST_sed4]